MVYNYFFSSNIKINGKVNKPSKQRILNVTTIPSKSLSTPVIKTQNAFSKNINDINNPLINEGLLDFNSIMIASKTGFAERTNKPRIINTGIIQKLSKIVNNHKKIGEAIPIIKSVFFLPNLSDIVPERSEPAEPAKEITERAIPDIQMLSPLIVK